jgi:hypothetical protein
MWQRFFEFIQQYVNLAEKMKRQEDKIHELQKQLRDLSQASAEESRASRSMIELLATELRHSQQREEAERKILKLELENRLLRQERGLPPAKKDPDESEEN